MEVVKVVCPRCGKRLFDLSLERPPGGTDDRMSALQDA